MARRPSCEGCNKPLRNDEDGLCTACLEPDGLDDNLDPYSDHDYDHEEAVIADREQTIALMQSGIGY